MSGYALPVRAGISCSRACHVDRRPPSSNPGTDWAAGMRTPVLSPTDGVVVRVSHVANQPQGRHVWVRDELVLPGAELQLMHFETPQVYAGQRVYRGSTALGLSGTTGHSTGPHLHLSLWRDGRNLDFMDYVGGPAGAGGTTPVAPAPPKESEYPDMFIAIVRKRDWYLVTGGKACLLGSASGARTSGAPILEFVDDWAVAQLKTIVSGIA